MSPEYVRAYADLYRRHWWWRARERLIVGTLQARAPNHGFGRILDIGCGAGLFFEKLSTFGEPEGVEADLTWKEAPQSEYGEVSFRPFDEDFRPEAGYGLVLMLDVLEHLENPATSVRHACRLLEERGLLVVTVPAFNVLWTSHDTLNHHVKRYTKRQLCELLSVAEIEIVTCRYLFQWLFFAKLGLRAMEAVRARTPGLPKIPSAAINSALLAFTLLEDRLASRIPLPFGSSLLAVARKKKGIAGRVHDSVRRTRALSQLRGVS